MSETTFLEIKNDEIGFVSDCDDQSFGMFCPVAVVSDPGYRNRIVACVNACAGIPTSQLEQSHRNRAVTALVDELTNLRADLTLSTKQTADCAFKMRQAQAKVQGLQFKLVKANSLLRSASLALRLHSGEEVDAVLEGIRKWKESGK